MTAALRTPDEDERRTTNMATIRLGDEAPNFTAESTEGTVDLHEWLGDSWGVLFSHPADFTPVCTTELGAVAWLRDQFAARDTKVAAVSVDRAESHRAWSADIAETQGAEVDFPLIADPDRHVATLYGMIHRATTPPPPSARCSSSPATRRSSSR